MDKKQYRTISTGRGGEFRNLANSMLNGAAALPSQTELRDAIDELYPQADTAVRTAIFTALVGLAKAGAAGGDKLELRGKADALVLTTEEGLAKFDRIVQVPDEEPLDLDAFNEGQAELDAGGAYALAEKRRTDAAYSEAERLKGLSR